MDTTLGGLGTTLNHAVTFASELVQSDRVELEATLRLLRPPMGAERIRADIIELHVVLGTLRIGLRLSDIVVQFKRKEAIVIT